MVWVILFFLFPVSVIDGKAYNANKLKELSKQRELAYNEMYISLNDEVNEIIYNLYIKPFDLEIIYEVQNEYIDVQSTLKNFYTKSADVDKTYYQLMAECNSKISFPFQNKKQYLLEEIFTAQINVIKHANKIYNEFALNLLMEQYEYIMKRIVGEKTGDIMAYIDFYSSNSETRLLSITDFIGYKYYYEITDESFFDAYINQCLITNKIFDEIIINISEVPFPNIPVILIDDVCYDSGTINELQKSMETVSPYLIQKTKNILIEGVNRQTRAYSENINKYVDWYYSSFTAFDKALTNFFGFLDGEKNAQDRFYFDNFNRIMNKNADFDYIIGGDIDKQINIIYNIFNEYFALKDYFSINIKQIALDIITGGDYIEPYIDGIVVYFDQVSEALYNADIFYHQEYTVKDSNMIKSAKTVIKLLPNVNFFGGMLVDYVSLKAHQLFKSTELRQKIYDGMIENQENKIAIINDPFNYLFDKLSIGSVLFVDNYFAGFNTYQHYGVYIGNGNVIHFAPHEGQEISMENGIIHETTLEKFLNGRALQIEANIGRKFSENEIVQRARSRLGEKGYNLLTNNCEHFALWCVTGEHISYQVINSPGKLESALSGIREKYDAVTKFIQLFR
jgi:RNAse (barnase) inhibitor barstar